MRSMGRRHLVWMVTGLEIWKWEICGRRERKMFTSDLLYYVSLGQECEQKLSKLFKEFLVEEEIEIPEK
jgi:hypothetical protein